MPQDAVPLSVTRDAATALWTITAPRHSLGLPTADGDQVLLLVAGRLSALDRADGRPLWRSPHEIGEVEYPRSLPLTVTRDQVLVPSDMPAPYRATPIALTCLRRTDGELAWCSDTVPLSGFQADDRTLVRWLRDPEVDGPRYIEAVDLADGRTLWRHEHDSIGSVVLADGRVFARTGGPIAVTAFDARTGARCWIRKVEQARGALSLVRGDATRKTVLLATAEGPGTVTRIDPATGAELGSLTLRGVSRYGDRWLTGGAAGPESWVGVGRLRLRRLGPFDGLRKRTFFAPLRELNWYDDRAVMEVADRLYTVVRLHLGHPENDRGNRIVSARIGGLGPRLLSGLRWPPDVPRRERRGFMIDLTPGPSHLFAVLHRLDGQDLAAARDGQVLWRRAVHPGLPVPVGGDRVLVFDDCGAHDHLRLLDAETGLGAAPQMCGGQPSSPTA